MSDFVEVYAQDFPIEDSLCFTCKYRVSRVIAPLDLESMGLDIDDFDLDEDEDLVIEQHTCTALMQDMSYVVLECNKYENINKEPAELFRHDM